MKVLHVYKTCAPTSFGGVEKVIDQIASHSTKYGVKTTVLSLTKEKKESTLNMNGYTIHRVPQLFEVSSCPFSIKIFKKFKELANNHDVIHYHFPWPFVDILHFLSGIKKKSIVTYHSDIVKQKLLLKFYSPLMNTFLKSVNKIVATSPNYLQTSEVLKNFKEKVSVIPIGLDKLDYPEPSKTNLNIWKKRFNKKFFLFIGNTRYYKGLDFLIDAAKHTKSDIVIVGKITNEDIIIKAKKLDCTNVHFVGEIQDEDKISLLTLCYGLVMPSHLRSEAFGISLLEGAMFGKPLISCEIGTGTTFINIHNETGVVVQPRNTEDLYNAMNFLLDNESTAIAMGKNSQKRYNKIFTADIMVKSYFNLLANILKK